MGMILGYIAVQTGSIVPCMVFHVCHNALAVVGARITPDMLSKWPSLNNTIFPSSGVGGCSFGWTVILAGLLAAFLLLAWFRRLPWRQSSEEAMQEAIRRGDQGVLVPGCSS